MSKELIARVEEALKTIRPHLVADGGDVEVLDVTEDKTVMLQLKGACSTCSMSHMTMKAGIEEAIRHAVPEIMAVQSVHN